jgi:hypothetical protein
VSNSLFYASVFSIAQGNLPTNDQLPKATIRDRPRAIVPARGELGQGGGSAGRPGFEVGRRVRLG